MWKTLKFYLKDNDAQEAYRGEYKWVWSSQPNDSEKDFELDN